jgi:SurA-like N-terminal domain
MKTRIIYAPVIMVMLIATFMLFACKRNGSPDATSSPEAHQKEMLNKSFEESQKRTAATVNGEAITLFSVLSEMNAIAPQYLIPGHPATPEVKAKIRTDALNTLIIQALAVQEAREHGLKVQAKAIDDEIKKIKTDKGSEAAYQAYLSDNGLSETELRKMIEQHRLFELIAAREVDAKIIITDAALRERFAREQAGLSDSPHHTKMTFEEAMGMLTLMVRAEAEEKRMREWEKELRQNARIEVPDQKTGAGLNRR